MSQALSRSKRVVGLIIAGRAALIPLIGSTTVSAIALIQEIKTANFVNHLAKNVTNVLSIQKDLDNSETSLDVLAMHTEIMNLKHASPLSLDAAAIADKTVHSLRSVFRFWSSFKNGIYVLIMLALLVLGILLFLPILLKLVFNNINLLAAKVNGLKLRMNPQAQSLI